MEPSKTGLKKTWSKCPAAVSFKSLVLVIDIVQLIRKAGMHLPAAKI
jgi:hypothetical protein